MSILVTKPDAEINRSMIKLLPELDSDYAKYPMHWERWYQPSEKGPKGEPCFVAGTQKDGGIKKDYVYCKTGGNGPGYYSLMTKVSYVNLYTKLDSMSPGGTCGIGCTSADRRAMDEYDDVKRVLYGRHFAPRPCDKAAGKRTMDEAHGMAQAAYGGDVGVGAGGAVTLIALTDSKVKM